MSEEEYTRTFYSTPNRSDISRWTFAYYAVEALHIYFQERAKSWKELDPRGEAGQSLGGVPPLPHLWKHEIGNLYDIKSEAQL